MPTGTVTRTGWSGRSAGSPRCRRPRCAAGAPTCRRAEVRTSGCSRTPWSARRCGTANAAAPRAIARRVSLHRDRRHAPPAERHAGPSMISVAPLDGSLSTWDAFATAVPGSTFCHLAGWRAVMEDVLGHECFYTIACDDAGAWRGILPLVRVRSALFGDYLFSLPFL